MNKLLLIFVIATTFCLAADPFVGTWRPNLEKWKGSEDMKSEVLTFEATGKDQYRLIGTRDGKPTGNPPVVWIVDGKERKEDETTSKIDRIDDHHLRVQRSSSVGNVVNDWVVSPNGKTVTVTRKGIGQKGQSVDTLWVYDKQ
jgi:hypothetical protein